MAKIQINSEKLTPFGGIISGHGAILLHIVSNEGMCTRKKDVERLSCGFEVVLWHLTFVVEAQSRQASCNARLEYIACLSGKFLDFVGIHTILILMG